MDLSSMKRAGMEKSDLQILGEQVTQRDKGKELENLKNSGIMSKVLGHQISHVPEMSDEHLADFKAQVKEAQAVIISEQSKRKEKEGGTNTRDRIADIFG
ncbi:MAG: hypothetical protein FWE31_00320 [Firmicutes bacterium]|nr:hypothetical protein [Bacillota bacterium]